VTGKSADSNSPWQIRPRTVIVRGRYVQGQVQFFANAEIFYPNLQRTVISRLRHVFGLLLSTDVVPDAYHCPQTHFYEVPTVIFAYKSNWAGTGPLKGFYVNCELAL
jgi:hypothetical protein